MFGGWTENSEVRDMSISIGEITAAKGQKKTGFLVAGELPTGTIDLPITILNGVRSGPNISRYCWGAWMRISWHESGSDNRQ